MTVQQIMPPLRKEQATQINLAVVSTVFPEARRFTLPDNLTIAEMMRESRIPRSLRRQAKCYIRSAQGRERYIAPQVWHLVKVRPGETATLKVRPAGGGRGGGKSTMAIILSVVVMAVSAFASFGVTALLSSAAVGLSAGAAGALGSIAGGLVGMLGKLATNALVPPPKQSRAQSKGASYGRADSPSYAITGTRNQLNPYGPLARIYGRTRHTPVYAALPYTEINGSDQYLRCLFSFGYGPLELDESSLKLGETPLSEFQGVQYVWHESYQGTGLEIYTNDVAETQLSLEITNDGIRTSAVAAVSTLTFAGNAADAQTLTIGTRVYTIKAALGTAADQILLGANAAETIDNIVAAINLSGSAGVQYTASTPENTQVSADATSTTTLKITARTAGVAANSIATTDTITNASWTGATMAGGVDAVMIPTIATVEERIGDRLEMTEDEKWISTTTLGSIDKFSGDVTFPEGLTLFREDRNEGFTARLEWNVRFDIRYREAGSSDPWIYLSTAATNILTCSAQPANGETVTIGGKVYAFQTTLTNVDGNVARGASLTEALANLAAAINLGSGAGTAYAAAMTQNPAATATGSTATQLSVEARRLGHITGDHGKYITVSETLTNGSWASTTFTGGADALRAKAADSVVRRGFGPVTPATNGQWDVQIRRLSAAADNEGPGRIDRVTIRDKAVLTVIRSIKNVSPVAKTGVALLEMRIKASGQLQQVIENLNGIVTAKLRTWDGADWTAPVATRLAAWAALDALQGSANGEPVADARILLSSFKDWADRDGTLGDDGEPLFTCDGVFDFSGTVGEAVADIAATGRATVGMQDGLFTAVMDLPQTVPVQMFTPRNSWDCRIRFVYGKLPHALRVRFRNEEKGWVEDEIVVYADGYSKDGAGDTEVATEFEEMTQPLITRPDQIWRQARYDMAVARLRNVEYSVSADPEWFEIYRGNLCLLQYDVVRVGQKSARVIEVISSDGDPDEIVAIRVDELVSMTAGETYALQWRGLTGADEHRFELYSVLTEPGDTDELTFLVPRDIADAPEEGDMVSFGIADRVTTRVIVNSIIPDPQMHARITFLDEAPDIHDADQGIPAYDPGTTPLPPPQNRKPQKPSIAAIKSDEEVLAVNPDGSLQSVIQITFGTLSGGTVPVASYAARFKRTGSDAAWSPPITVPVNQGSLTITPVDDLVQYDIEVWSVSAFGIQSDITPIAAHEVVGKTTPPPDPVNGRIEAGELRWDYPKRPVDLLGYKVRINPGGVFDWTGATIQPEGFLAENRFDISFLGRGTYAVMVKAQDKGFRLSEGYTGSTLIVGAPVFQNIVETFDISGGGFTGDITNGSVDGGVLVADLELSGAWPANPLAAAWSSNPAAAAWGASAMEMTYVHEINPGADSIGGELRIDAEISGAAWAIFYSTDDVTYLPWPGRVTIEDSTTYWIKIVTSGGDVPGEIAELQVYTEVPDETEHLDDIAIAATTGTRLPITKSYLSFKGLNPVIRYHVGETAVGVRIVDLDPDLGPLMECIDAAGAVVAGHIDADPIGAKDMNP
jgi:hypothetical protein